VGRKVFVTSDISIDEGLIIVAERDPLAALIWPWILTALDDWGRAEAKPRMLKAKVFPCNNMINVESIETALRLYHEVGLIELYEVESRPYLSVPHDKWFKYQTHIRRDKRNVDESKYPAPPLSLDCAESREESRENEPSPSPSPTPSLTPTPSVYNNNNNNACGENEQGVAENEETVSEKPQVVSIPGKTVAKTEESRPMDLGTRAVVWAEKNWGRPISPGEIEAIISWCDDFFSRGSPSPDDVVIEALNECDAAGPDARNKRYLAGILVKWLEAGVITVDQAKTRSAEHKCKSHKERKRKNKDPGDKPPDPPRTPPSKYENFYL